MISKQQITKKHFALDKFLTRNLRISHEDRKGYYLKRTFLQICVKRVYLTHIIDRRDEDFISDDPLEVNYKAFKRSKVLKILKTFKVSSDIQLDWLENLKGSKNLKTFSINSPNFAVDIQKITLSFKRLPVTIQSCALNIYVQVGHKEKQMCQIAKCVRRLPNLGCFQRNISCSWKRTSELILKELRTYSQSAVRLKKIKQFDYNGTSGLSDGFQKVMRRNFLFPGISGLELSLHSDPNHHQFKPFFGRQDFDGCLPDWQDMSIYQRQTYKIIQDEMTNRDQPGESTDLLNDVDGTAGFSKRLNPFLSDKDFIAKCIMREEIRPFYRFELFPDLKKLSFRSWNVLYPLGPFVVEGLSSLKKLEDLKICFIGRPMGIIYLFKSFLQLPLLKKFSLTINPLKPEDWELFKQFLRSQKKLQSFALEIQDPPSTKSDFLQQDAHLENLIMSLDHFPSLRSLKLKSDYWFLETISRGFAQLKMVNQLQTLSIKTSDASNTDQQNSWQRVEGLCTFVKNQKESLRKFNISLPLVIDDEILTHILKAVSELSQLRKLKIQIQWRFEMIALKSYIERTLGGFVPGGRFRVWSPNVHPLRMLQSLETFILKVKMRFLGEIERNLWLVDTLRAISSLPKLRRIFMLVSSEESFGVLPKRMVAPVLELTTTPDVEINLFNRNEAEDSISESALDEALCIFKQRQSTRCDLMF